MFSTFLLRWKTPHAKRPRPLRSGALTPSFSLTQVEFIFPTKSIVPNVFSASRENLDLLAHEPRSTHSTTTSRWCPPWQPKILDQPPPKPKSQPTHLAPQNLDPNQSCSSSINQNPNPYIGFAGNRSEMLEVGMASSTWGRFLPWWIGYMQEQDWPCLIEKFSISSFQMWTQKIL